MKSSPVCTLFCCLFCFTVVSFAQDLPPYPFRNTTLPREERVADLVGRMTLQEKIGQMQNHAPAIPRLGIPEYNWWNEALHGVARNGIATVFPQAVGMAATWDPDLIRQEADVISTEARAKHNEALRNGASGIYQGLTFWSPNINIFRDPRWGRGQETYGEDPFLTSRIGVAFVHGLQGENARYLKSIATPKHFAVHSGPEPLRHMFDARPPVVDLYETYLPAFEACVTEGGARSVMGAYNSLYGQPCCASELLLGRILRDEWRFTGYVVSDCGAIADIHAGHRVASTVIEAAATAVRAGCDLTCGEEYESLPEAIAEHLVTESDIDRCLRRLMKARFDLGMFDPPGDVPYARISPDENNTKEHCSLARKVAQESIVLLKNRKNHLPLPKAIRSVAVIGPSANDVNVLLGNYNGTPSDPVTVLQGIRQKLGPSAIVRYARGCDLTENLPASLKTIPSKFLSTNHNGRLFHGLSGEYFSTMSPTGEPVLNRIDSTVDFVWYGAPAPGLPADHFSVRWKGQLITDSSGTYVLGVTVNDGCRLFLDGMTIIDAWETGTRRTVTKEVRLEEGRQYNIVLEFFDDRWSAAAQLGWMRKERDPLSDALTAAEASDEIVTVLGLSPALEGEEMPIHLRGFKGGDRTDLNIPATQQSLVRALSALGKPMVLVLLNGSALNFDDESFEAVVECWYPGEQGGNAVADVLFGDYNPAGRLPITFYRSVSDLPPFEDYSMHGRTYRYYRGKPLFPFGYGMSFTTFVYSGIRVDHANFSADDTATVMVNVKNSGQTDGDEVVQLYVKEISARGDQPLRSLKGFAREHFRAGEARPVILRVPISSLRVYDVHTSRTRVHSGDYEFEVGTSSADIRLRTTIRVSE
jgi:beta-glucosidase